MLTSPDYLNNNDVDPTDIFSKELSKDKFYRSLGYKMGFVDQVYNTMSARDKQQEYDGGLKKIEEISNRAYEEGLAEIVARNIKLALKDVPKEQAARPEALSKAILMRAYATNAEAMGKIDDIGAERKMESSKLSELEGWAGMEMVRVAAQLKELGSLNPRPEIMEATKARGGQINMDDWKIDKWSKMWQQVQDEIKAAETKSASGEESTERTGPDAPKSSLDEAIEFVTKVGKMIPAPVVAFASAYIGAAVDDAMEDWKHKREHNRAHVRQGEPAQARPEPQAAQAPRQTEAPQPRVHTQQESAPNAPQQPQVVEVKLGDEIGQALHQSAETNRQILEELKESRKKKDEEERLLKEIGGIGKEAKMDPVEADYAKRHKKLSERVDSGKCSSCGGEVGDADLCPYCKDVTPRKMLKSLEASYADYQELKAGRVKQSEKSDGSRSGTPSTDSGEPQAQAQTKDIRDWDWDETGRRKQGLTEEDEKKLREGDAMAWVRLAMSKLEDPTLSRAVRADEATRLQTGLAYLRAVKTSEEGKNEYNEIREYYFARNDFNAVFDKFDDIKEGEIGAGMASVRGTFKEKFEGIKGKENWRKFLAESAPVIVAIEKDGDRLFKYITGIEGDEKPADDEEHLRIKIDIVKKIAEEIKKDGMTDDEAIGEAWRGIKMWRLLGREALFNAFLRRDKRKVKFVNPDLQDATLAKLMAGEVKQDLFSRGSIDDTMRRYMDVMARDAISLNANGKLKRNDRRIVDQIKSESDLTGCGLAAEKVRDWMEGIERSAKTLEAMEKWVVDPKPETFAALGNVWSQGYKFEDMIDLKEGEESPIYWITEERGPIWNRKKEPVFVDSDIVEMKEVRNLIMAYLAKETLRVCALKRTSKDPSHVTLDVPSLRSALIKMFPESDYFNSKTPQKQIDAMLDFIGEGLNVRGLAKAIGREKFWGIKPKK